MADTITIKAVHGDIAGSTAPVICVNLYQDVDKPSGATAAVDEAFGGVVTNALASGDFKGKAGELVLLYPGGKSRILLVGLGKKEDFDTDVARKVGGAIGNKLRDMDVKYMATVLHGGDSGNKTDDLARGLTEGLVLSLYRYHDYFRDGRAQALKLEDVHIVEKNRSRIKGIDRGINTGSNIADSMNFTRDLVNGPPNEVTPTYLANKAKSLGKKFGMKVRVMDRDQCEKLGMGAFLAVAQGSEEPCKFMVMEYDGGSKGTLCLVGKGITFDTGGISLKPGADMDLMKYDMGGSAAVFGAMHFAASQKIPMKVVGIISSTENMPSGKAYKPGDIITASNGVTIEIKNTDAEGRMILSDALVYAERYEPDAVVDLATLTGACVIALGSATAAMGNDEWLLDQVTDAGLASGERVWPMPLWREYREQVKSTVADIRNAAGRDAGALTAGAFLGAFTDNYRWVHMDIAGAAWNDRPTPTMGQGAAGGGVRTLAQLMMDWKKPRGTGAKPGHRTTLRGITPEVPKKAEKPAKKSAPKKKAKSKKKRSKRR